MKPLQFKIDHLPFIKMRKQYLSNWEKMKRSTDRFSAPFRAIPTTYVNTHDLKKKPEL